MEGEALTMLEAITQGVTHGITIVGEVVTAIVGASGAMSALLPVIGLSIGFGAIGFGIAKIKSLVWGL